MASTSGLPRLRSDLDLIPSYKAGQRPIPREDIVVYKASSNENPYPPLPGVLEAIASSAATMQRYPDPFSTRLVEALALKFDLPPDRIGLGTGSVALCGQIIQAATHPGDEVIYAWRSFESYPIWTRMSHAVSVQVPLRADESHDVEAMAAAVTDRTRVIFCCTPNNPTGQAITALEMDWLLDQVPEDVIVVIDEAYREFVTDPAIPDGINIAKQRANVVVLRTFSKAYGLAGLRVGFSVADPAVIEAMRKFALPFGVSSIAEEAALASLEREGELFARVQALATERERIWQALVDQGWPLHATQANFIWFRLGELSVPFAQACEAAGITVRPFPGEGVRVSIVETESNDRLLAVAADFLAGHAHLALRG